MRIYTRQGDDGHTRLADGSQRAKDDIRVESYGTIDELNSWIGLLLAEIPPEEAGLSAELLLLQQELFDLGGELALPGEVQEAARWQVNDSWTERLERQIDAYSAQLPPLCHFILPSGSRAAAQAHVVRTMVRRCERQLLSLSREERINPAILPYLNRLSDWFFTIARYLLAVTGTPEVRWVKAAERAVR